MIHFLRRSQVYKVPFFPLQFSSFIGILSLSSDPGFFTAFRKENYGPFLWMGFNCLKATEPLRGYSLLFTTQSPEVPGTHLSDLGRINGWTINGWPWSQSTSGFELGTLHRETRTLTTMPLLENQQWVVARIEISEFI